MKQLLATLLTCLTLSASAQVQYVKDTTEADNTLLVTPKSGAMKYDKLGVHPTITGNIYSVSQINQTQFVVTSFNSTSTPIDGCLSGNEFQIETY